MYMNLRLRVPVHSAHPNFLRSLKFSKTAHLPRGNTVRLKKVIRMFVTFNKTVVKMASFLKD